jgi:hypothetical protein
MSASGAGRSEAERRRLHAVLACLQAQNHTSIDLPSLKPIKAIVDGAQWLCFDSRLDFGSCQDIALLIYLWI